MPWTSIAATPSEATEPLPGDALIPAPVASATHAVTILCRPEALWPWLVQMGAGRAGWYSYDRLDNGGVASAETIRPALQSVAAGDVMPALPGATDAFIVDDVVSASHLVLRAPDPTAGAPVPAVRATWSFTLRPVAEGTRLVVRARLSRLLVGPAGHEREVPETFASLLVRPVHSLMERHQLLGLKARAEHHGDPR